MQHRWRRSGAHVNKNKLLRQQLAYHNGWIVPDDEVWFYLYSLRPESLRLANQAAVVSGIFHCSTLYNVYITEITWKSFGSFPTYEPRWQVDEAYRIRSSPLCSDTPLVTCDCELWLIWWWQTGVRQCVLLFPVRLCRFVKGTLFCYQEEESS